MSETTVITKIQPLVAVTAKRIECDCGTIAVYFAFNREELKDEYEDTYAFYCQPCWEKAVGEAREDDSML